MARATLKTKNKAGQPYRCVKCTERIEAGQKYYRWKFRYGGTYRQHASHGAPKASQLTQSKMSGVYAATETAEEVIGKATSVEEMVSALNDCAQSIRDVHQEYQDGLDNMPDGLREAAESGQTGETMNALEEFADALESKASDLEGEDYEPEGEEEHADGFNNWLNDKRSEAEETLSELSI